MTDYTKLTDFAAKDALLSGNPSKVVKGTELGAEFDAIATAVATKADSIDITNMLETSDIGVSVQAYDADLTSWAAIAPSAKQDALVSGTNIKTVGGTSLLGSGNIAVGLGDMLLGTAQSVTAAKTFDPTALLVKGSSTGTTTLTTANTGASNYTATLPASTGTILTTAAAVTVAQGGTGLTTLTANNVMLGNGTSTPTFVAPSTSGNVLTSNGTTWTSASPSGSVTDGNLVLITTVTASGATSASFASQITTTYDFYVLRIYGWVVTSSSSSSQSLLLSSPEGTSYSQVTIGNRSSSPGAGVINGDIWIHVAGKNAGFQSFMLADGGSSTVMDFLNVSPPSYSGTTPSRVSGFSVYMGSNPPFNGTFKLYGVKKT